jgi:hypothetical protein
MMPSADSSRRSRAPVRVRRRDLIRIQGFRLPRPRSGADPDRRLDVRLWLDLWDAARRNRIERTVDYRRVHRVLRAAARRPGRGLAERLVEAILKGFPRVDAAEVRLRWGAGIRCRRSRSAPDGAGKRG